MDPITTPHLGDRARDNVTGFEGIVTGEATYLTGCVQLLLAPAVAKDGDYRESQWFDADRCTVLAADALQVPVTSPGPDRPAPKR